MRTNRHFLRVCVLAGLALAVPAALAQDKGDSAGNAGGKGKAHRKGVPGVKHLNGPDARTSEIGQRLTTELTLTEDQQAAVREILQQDGTAMRQQLETVNNSEAAQQVKSLRRELKDATDAGDDAKAEALRTQIRSLSEGVNQQRAEA